MVNRICIGDHPSFGMGLYVSQPGIDVLTANKFQMSWSTLFDQFQIITSGGVIIPGEEQPPVWSATFSWPDTGYYPLIIGGHPNCSIIVEYLSQNSARARRAAVDETLRVIFVPDYAGTVPSDYFLFYVLRTQKPW